MKLARTFLGVPTTPSSTEVVLLQLAGNHVRLLVDGDLQLEQVSPVSGMGLAGVAYASSTEVCKAVDAVTRPGFKMRFFDDAHNYCSADAPKKRAGNGLSVS